MAEELERRFLVRNLPDNLNEYPSSEIIQGYLPSPVPEVLELRIKKKLKKEGELYVYTSKIGQPPGRLEAETEIPHEYFETLWPEIIGWVEKTRFEIPVWRYTAELDIFSGGAHEGVMGHKTLEIEFDNEIEMEIFVPSEWFGEEITGIRGFDNYNLAVQGFPRFS